MIQVKCDVCMDIPGCSRYTVSTSWIDFSQNSSGLKLYSLQQILETLRNETEDASFRKSIKRVPISYQDSAGKSLSSLIILHSQQPLKHTRAVLQMGYSVSTPDKNGWTPLHHTGNLFAVFEITVNYQNLTIPDLRTSF